MEVQAQDIVNRLSSGQKSVPKNNPNFSSVWLGWVNFQDLLSMKACKPVLGDFGFGQGQVGSGRLELAIFGLIYALGTLFGDQRLAGHDSITKLPS
jgi:hypothetical protein